MSKKLLLKGISCVLAFVLLINAFPAIALDLQTEKQIIEEFERPAPAVTEMVRDKKYKKYTLDHVPEKIKENAKIDTAVELDISDAEDSNTLTVINSDGTKTVKMFDSPIKYVDEETDMVQFIDNSLTVSKDSAYAYECVTNERKTFFPKDISSGVKLTHKDYTVTLRPNSPINSDAKNEKAIILPSKVEIEEEDYAQYTNVFGEKTTLQYSPTNQGVKENLVLDEYTGQNEFGYIMNAEGLEPKETEGTTITFIDSITKAEVLKVKETFVYDSRYTEDSGNENAISYNNYYKVQEQEDGSYLLTTTVDKAFLESSDTVYPVVIDPQIQWHSLLEPIQLSSVSNTGTSADNGIVGNFEDKTWRTYFRIPNFYKYQYLNPDLIKKVDMVMYFEENVVSNANVYFSSTTNESTLFAKALYSATYTDCFTNLSSKSSDPYFNAYNEDTVDITEYFKSWLLTDLTNGDDTFIPGFVAYMKTPASGSVEFSYTCPYLSIQYLEDHSISDDLYYIKNGDNYLYAHVKNDNTIQTYWKTITDTTTPTPTSEYGYLWYVKAHYVTGLYSIKSYLDHEAITDHYLHDDGIDVTVRKKQETSRQQWRIVKNSGESTYRIISDFSEDGGAGIGALTTKTRLLYHNPIETPNYEGDASQKWIFVKCPSTSVKEMRERPVSLWPNEAKTSANLLHGLEPRSMEYKVKGNIITTGTGTATAFGKTTMTDGYISGSNMDIRGYTLTQDGENGYMRFVTRDTKEYRPKGELYLDITFDLGSKKSLDSLWFATNTNDSYYKVGSFDIYVSNTIESLYFTKNKRATFDNRSSKWSGVANLDFNSNFKGRYIGLRITQGVINQNWTASDLEHAYARMRGLAVFSKELTTVELNDYYDNGMLTRWGATRTQMADGIAYYSRIAESFYESLEYNGQNMGINIGYTSPGIYASPADSCGYSTLSALNSLCTEAADHNSSDSYFEALDDDHPYSTDPKIVPILWTGHLVDDKTNVGVALGTSSYKSRIIMQNIGVSRDQLNTQLSISNFKNSAHRAHRTYLHEIAHCLGAKDSYCKKDGYPCTNDFCATCNQEEGYEETCIMARFEPNPNTTGIYMYDYDQDQWLCNKCKQDIHNCIYGG